MKMTKFKAACMAPFMVIGFIVFIPIMGFIGGAFVCMETVADVGADAVETLKKMFKRGHE